MGGLNKQGEEKNRGAVGKQIVPEQRGYDSQRVIPSLNLSEKRKKDG